MALLKNPLILALDVDSKEEAHKILHPIADLVGGIKVGPRLVYRYGASLVTELSKRAPVFVDNKYFDIPSTMASAVLASFEAGATLVTVHSMAGSEALSQLATLEKELNQIRPFKI
jgi:orotidine-5'-phosphate decarboxylase